MIDVRTMVASLLRYRVLIAGLACALALVGVAGAGLQPRKYTASVSILLSPQQSQIVDQDRPAQSASDAAIVQSQMAVVRSRELATRLVDKWRLDRDPEWNQMLRPRPGYAVASSWIKSIFGSESAPPSADAGRETATQAVMAAIGARRIDESLAFEITLTGANDKRTAALVNSLGDIYIDWQLEERFESAQRANSWLAERIATLQADVSKKEAAVEAFRARSGLLATQGATLTERRLQEAQDSALAARADLAAAEARRKLVADLQKDGAPIDSVAAVLDSPVIRELRARDGEIARRLAEMQSRYGGLHPSINKARAERDDVKGQIEAEIGRILASLDNEVTVARSRLAALEQGSQHATTDLTANNTALVRLRELERDAAASREVYETYLRRNQELADRQTLKLADASVISKAPSAARANSRNLPLVFTLWFSFGALLGLGIAAAAEVFRDALVGADDVTAKIGLPAVASIPVIRSSAFRGAEAERRNMQSYLLDHPMSSLAESFRVVRHFANRRIGRDRWALAITSALPEEGKTAVALGLARTIALGGQRTLLIDCDVRRKALSALVGQGGEQGIVNVLKGEAPWRAAVSRDQETPLEVIRAVHAQFFHADLFASSAMETLLDEARQEYECIILDCPPVMALAETRSLSAIADATLVIAFWSRTSGRAVRNAVDQIEMAGGNPIGVVLNAVDPRAPGRDSFGDSLYYSQAVKRYYAA